MRLFKRKVHKSVSDGNVVEITEADGIRYLNLGSNTMQSGMLVAAPLALIFNYSRGMMYFLLFSKNIKKVLMIGLGGGSITKYMHAYCPKIKQTVVEINAEVIKVARSHFFVPEDDEKLSVVEGDGVRYLSDHPESQDCVIIDGFDAGGVPDDLCTQDFFDRCFDVLRSNGIFAMNLWGSDKNFDIYLQRIEQSFGGRVVAMPTGRPGNIIVFGFKHAVKLTEKKLRERAKQLESTHIIEFTEFLDNLHAQNGHQNLYSTLESP